MLLQHDNYGFSDSVVFRSKAQCEGNGYPLGKHWNAVAGHHSVAYMDVGEGREQDAVSFAPLNKGAAIACEVRLVVNVDKLTELAIIMLKEH